MNLKNISKLTPIEPGIECDGWYTYCVRCLEEIEPLTNVCPNCGQTQDWSWLERKE